MRHPELLKKMGKTKHREALGLFQCPFCPNTFIARIDQVINEHTKSCGCRKKKNFVMALERRIKGKLTAETLAHLYGERLSGLPKAYLSKKFGIRPSEYSVAVRLAQEAYLKPSTPEVDVEPRASRAASDALKPALEQPVPQTIIKVENGGTLIMNQRPTHDISTYKPATAPQREIPYEQTEAGYVALGEYWKEFKQPPADDFDLKSWYQQRTVN